MKRINWTYVAVKTVVMMFMIGAATISFGHIVETSHRLGLTWESYTVPFFVDGLAILGLIGRTSSFARSTNRAGWVLILTAGSASLAANIYAGRNLGQQLYGGLVVVGFALAEWYATKLKAAPVSQDAPRQTVKVRMTDAEKAARKRAGYRDMSPAEKAAWTKNYRERVSRKAPTSPGRAPVSAPSAEELEERYAG